MSVTSGFERSTGAAGAGAREAERLLLAKQGAATTIVASRSAAPRLKRRPSHAVRKASAALSTRTPALASREIGAQIFESVRTSLLIHQPSSVAKPKAKVTAATVDCDRPRRRRVTTRATAPRTTP